MNYIIKYENENLIKISKDVIISIVTTVINENSNIISLNYNFLDKLVKNITNKNINIIQLNENNVTIEIYVNINYGYNIYTTVEFIQKSIINAIESMTRIKNIQIDINVCKIIFSKKINDDQNYE